MRDKKFNILILLKSCNIFTTALLSSSLWYVCSRIILLVSPVLKICPELFGRMIVAMNYFALILNTSNLHGDPYLNCFLSAATEIPAYIVVLLLLRHSSRRLCQSATLLLGGIMIICVNLIPTGKILTESALFTTFTARTVMLGFSHVKFYCS